MTHEELRALFAQCVTVEYPNGWAVYSYSPEPLEDAGFNKVPVPEEYDHWDEAWTNQTDLILVGWHSSQTTMEYYCQPVPGYYTPAQEWTC